MTTTILNQTASEQQMTSIELAQLVGKSHNDVLKAIRKMEPAWEAEHQGKFSRMSIREKLPNNGYRFRPVYVLSKAETLYIATKFNDVARARLVLRWEELELSNSRSAREQIVDEGRLLVTEKEIMRQSDEIMERDISEANRKAETCYSMTQVAKAVKMDRKALTSLLVRLGVMLWTGDRYELDTDYDKFGYAEYRHYQGYSLKGRRYKNTYMVWTEAGRDFVRNLVEGYNE